MTEWPRGLVDYTPTGPADAAPSPEEDRDLNRLRLASRLLGHLRPQGPAVDALVARLHDADRAFRDGDRAGCKRIVEGVIADAEKLLGRPTDPKRAAP